MGSRTPKRILIVGGVAGGMSCATRLRRLDESASITVFEKGPYVSFANCGIPYGISEVIPDRESLILNTPEGFKKRFNLDVVVNAEVVKVDRDRKVIVVKHKGEAKGEEENEKEKEWAYDVLVLAPGAEPVKLNVPGAQGEQVFHLTTIEDMDGVNGFIEKHSVKQACVVGGGFIGLEAAENLKLRGLEVTLLEWAGQVLTSYDRDMVGTFPPSALSLSPFHSWVGETGTD